MSCCGSKANNSSVCCNTNTNVDREWDFANNGWCPSKWASLGTDGTICAGPDGLSIDSTVFTQTPSDPTKGLLDNFKANYYSPEPIYLKKFHETILNSVVAGKQYYNTAAPFPDVFNKRIRNIFADPRLAHVQISFIDVDNGIIAGNAITDQAIFALYGRLPISAIQEICNFTDTSVVDCKPCQVACDKVYNCNNFFQDCRYIEFKTHATYNDFCRFVHFCAWADYADGANLSLNSWNDFLVYCGRFPIGEGLYESNWATWRGFNQWTEYQYFVRWYSWEAQAKLWQVNGACCPPNEGVCPTIGGCGSCGQKALDRLSANCKPTLGGCGGCAGTVVGAAVVNPEQYPYQFGIQRCCCCYDIASFLDLVEIQRREACDPLCDFVNLGVGINTCASTINWYINKQLVLRHVGIGRRMSEQYRVRENGGYAEDVQIRRVVVDFGTGSLLDASLPNNYDRQRAKNDSVDMTNLVPLQDNLSDPNAKTNYYQIYGNILGGLLPVNRTETFAVVNADPAYRIFGQGARMNIRNITVVTRRVFNAYKVPRITCKPRCGTCNDKPGYCNDLGCNDCEDEPWCTNQVDARDFQIEYVPGYGTNEYTPTGPINVLSYPLGNSNNPAGFGARDFIGGNNQGAITPYVITQRPASKEYYKPKCFPETGINPYN